MPRQRLTAKAKVVFATPAQQRPARHAPSAFGPPGFRDELCAFFRGTGTDIECRTLEQILTWDDQLMEVCHDYIQWILPTDEASKFNFDAPVLDMELQRIFKSDQVIRRNLRRALQHFLAFLGIVSNLDKAGEEPLMMARAQRFPTRLLMCWRGPANHNWKRVSRALRCMGIVGMEEEQHALFACLEEVIVDYPGMVDEATIGHWIEQGSVKAKAKPLRAVTPGYIAALLGSPNLLASLCQQYFTRYDLNLDGRLCVTECLALCSDLHESLGLPADTVDRRRLSDSIAKCSHSLCLGEDTFPRWFYGILESTLESIEKAKVKLPEGEKLKRVNSDLQKVDAIDMTRVVQSEQEMSKRSKVDQTPELEVEKAEFRPEYLAALLDSSTLLNSVCTQYFTRYDKNADERIDFDEALTVARDLHTCLGVPANTPDENAVAASVRAFSRGGSGNALTAEQFYAWFSDVLHATGRGMQAVSIEVM